MRKNQKYFGGSQNISHDFYQSPSTSTGQNPLFVHSTDPRSVEQPVVVQAYGSHEKKVTRKARNFSDADYSGQRNCQSTKQPRESSIEHLVQRSKARPKHARH